MVTLASLFIFLGVLFVLILVHEWGHYIVAKRTGMRVDEFAIGFPPRLWSKTVGDTRYSLNAIPIGGYVKIYGEDGGEGTAEDKMRAFGARPRLAQALVLIAGVTMNVLLAWVLLISIQMIGVTSFVDEENATSNSRLVVQGTVPDSPADGNLLPQSVIVAISSTDQSMTENLTPRTFTEFVHEAGGSEVNISYITQEGEEGEVVLIPQRGVDELDEERLLIGVGLSLMEDVQYGLVEAIVRGTIQTIDLLNRIIIGIATLLQGLVLGKADLSEVAGPVGIVSYVGEAAAFGFTSLLFFTAVISLNLAIINLLPIPALDGGRLVFVAIESIIRRPLDPVWTTRMNTIGFLFLLALMLIVTVSDIGKFF